MPQTFPEIFYLFFHSIQTKNRDRPSRFATASRNQPSPDGRPLICSINQSLKKKTKN